MGTKRSARKRTRLKATPDEYPDVGPVELARAYAELPGSAFAVWIRLMIEPQEVLNRGRHETSKLLGYSKRQGDYIFRVLERFGYLTFLVRGRGKRTQISIQRRAILPLRSNFIQRAA